MIFIATRSQQLEFGRLEIRLDQLQTSIMKSRLDRLSAIEAKDLINEIREVERLDLNRRSRTMQYIADAQKGEYNVRSICKQASDYSSWMRFWMIFTAFIATAFSLGLSLLYRRKPVGV